MANWERTNLIELDGGMRLDLAGYASERIPLGWFEKLVNFNHTLSGQLTKRRGFDQWESGLSLGSAPYGVLTLRQADGTRYRLVLDDNSGDSRLWYAEAGGAWTALDTFLDTPQLRVRSVGLRGNGYLTNGVDDLRFFQSSSLYGKCGVWPPTTQPSTTFGADPSTDATDDSEEQLYNSGFLEYCVTFLYGDPVTGVAIHESPPSPRTGLINCHWGDNELASNENYGFIKKGVSLTVPTNTDIAAGIRDRVTRRRLYRRWKRYADLPWGEWTLCQEVVTGTSGTWVDVETTPTGILGFVNDVPPVGRLITSTENRLVLGDLKDRAVRQPGLPSTWRGGTGYTPKWPYRVMISITDTNHKVVTRGNVKMKFTNDVAHDGTVNPVSTGDGAYLSGIGSEDFLQIEAVTFTGSGLDDATSGGTFSGTVPTNYKVEIDGEGAPDTFKWSDDGGATWDATTVNITGAAQVLNNGVTITFVATTGHTLTDYWTFAAGYHDFCFVADDEVTEIGYVVDSLTTNDMFFTVEIPQLYGATFIYLFYGDANAPAYPEDQWESVFHKHYATTDMTLLCNFDVSDEDDDAIDRILGRKATRAAADWNGSDGGYYDDSKSKIYSTGDCIKVTGAAQHFAFESISSLASTTQTEGTVQGWIFFDWANRGMYNVLYSIKSSGFYYELEIYDPGGDAHVLRWASFNSNHNLQDVVATEILEDFNTAATDMWIFVTVTWSADGGYIFADSPDFGGGEEYETYTNADDASAELPNLLPHDEVYVGSKGDNVSMIGKHDDFVIFDRAKNVAETRQDFLRRTYWANAPQMELGTIATIYDAVNSVAVRDPRPNRIGWSNASAPDVFEVDNFREVDSGATVTGVETLKGNICVLCENEIRLLPTSTKAQALIPSGDVTEMWTLSQDRTAELRGVGNIAPDSVDVTSDYLLFYGHAGLYAYDLHSFYHCSLALDSVLKEYPAPFRRAIVGKVYPRDHQYWMAVVSGASTATDESQTAQDSSHDVGDSGDDQEVAQSFIPDFPLLDSVGLYKDTDGNGFASTVTIAIQKDDGDGDPDGNDIVSHTYSFAAWDAISNGAFSTDLPATLVPGDTYHIVVSVGAQDAVAHIHVNYQAATNLYASGSLKKSNGTVWSSVNYDLYFITSYAYHDRVFVLDLDSVGPDPERVRWTEYCWGATTTLKLDGFTLVDDISDQGELLCWDAYQSKIWKYDNGVYHDDTTATPIKTLAKTGKIDLFEAALRSVRTYYDAVNSSNTHYNILDLYIPDSTTPLITMSNVVRGADELCTADKILNRARFEWNSPDDLYDIRLKSFDFEFRKFRRRRVNRAI